MRADEQPSTSTPTGRGAASRTQKKDTANNAPEQQLQPSNPLLPNSEGRWAVWRIWNEGIYNAIEEHISSGNHMLSHLGLSKLFLDKLGIWGGDYRFHSPRATNFTKVFILRAVKFQADSATNLFWIKGVEVATAENAFEKERRRIVEMCGDQGRVVQGIAKEGDYLVIWGGTEKEAAEVSLRRKMIILNDDEDNEPSFLAIYRHNGEFCYPVNSHGYIQNNLKVDDVRNEFCTGERDDGTDVIHVHRIIPAKPSSHTWRLIPPETEAVADVVEMGNQTVEAPVPPPVAHDDPPPRFTSTPTPMPPPPRPSSNGEKAKVGSPVRSSTPSSPGILQPKRKLLPASKLRHNVVESDDEDEVMELDKSGTSTGNKSKTKEKTPTPTPAPPSRREKRLSLKSEGKQRKVVDVDYARIDEEEDHFEDAEDNLEVQEEGDGDSDGPIPVVDLADSDGEGTNSNSTAATFMTAGASPKSTSQQEQDTITPPENDVPPPEVGAEIEVSTSSSTPTEINQCVKDAVSDLVGGVVESENQSQEEPISLDEILELECIRRMCANTPDTSGNVNETLPLDPTGNAQGPSQDEENRSRVMSSPTAPKDVGSQDVNDPIWTQMQEMHYGSPNEASAGPSSQPASQEKSQVPAKTDTAEGSKSFAIPSVSSRAQGSRRNLFSQVEPGVFTQMVSADGGGEEEVVEMNDSSRDRKRRISSVDEEEVSTDEISGGRSGSQARATRGKRLKKVAATPPRAVSPVAVVPKPPSANRFRRNRAGMSQQSQQSDSEGGRKAIFPRATYDRMQRRKEKPAEEITIGTSSDDSASEASHASPEKRKKGKATKGAPFGVPKTPPRATRTRGASSARSEPPTPSPVKVTAKHPARTTTPSKGRKGKGKGSSVTSSPTKGRGGGRELRDRKKK